MPRTAIVGAHASVLAHFTSSPRRSTTPWSCQSTRSEEENALKEVASQPACPSVVGYRKYRSPKIVRLGSAKCPTTGEGNSELPSIVTPLMSCVYVDLEPRRLRPRNLCVSLHIRTVSLHIYLSPPRGKEPNLSNVCITIHLTHQARSPNDNRVRRGRH